MGLIKSPNNCKFSHKSAISVFYDTHKSVIMCIASLFILKYMSILSSDFVCRIQPNILSKANITYL